MPTAPTLVAYAETDWDTATVSSKATPSISWQTGDIIVAIAGDEGNTPRTLSVPTATGLTFSALGGGQIGGGGSACNANAWSATAASNGSGTVTFGINTSSTYGGAVWVWRGASAVARTDGAVSSALTTSVTRAQANSCIVTALFDFLAGSSTGYGWTPNPATNDRQHAQHGGAPNYTVYIADWGDQGSAGTTSYGLTGLSAGTYTKIAIEIQPVIPPSFARDTETVGTAFTSTGTQTVSHPGSANARAAVVLIDQNGTTADEVSGVTYGGTAMTRLRFDTEATEAGGVYIYWLDGIATGTQNVAMTTTAATNKQMTICTMTASTGASVAVAGHNSGTSASVANPSWTITGLTSASKLEAYEVIHSGLTTMTNTPASGWTLISSTDLGAQGRGFARQEVASSGTTLASGWTAATADDFVGSSVAFIEVAGSISGTAALTGSGTLGTTPVRSATAALSGSGSLGTTPSLAAVAALSGSGSLTAAPVRSGTAALSGSGTLAETFSLSISAALSGQGTLSAAPVRPSASAMSGSGTLSAAGGQAGSPALSGSGTLSAAGTRIASAALSGSGTLAATSTTGFPGSTALSGSGTLNAAVTLGKSAALSGSGTLNATPVTGFPGSAALSGSGTLTAIWTSAGLATATLSGSGTLSAVPIRLGTAALSGSGTLGAAGVKGFSGTAALSGAGTLAAVSTVTIAAVAALSGDGTLASAYVLTGLNIPEPQLNLAIRVSGRTALAAAVANRAGVAIDVQHIALGAKITSRIAVQSVVVHGNKLEMELS